MSYTLEIKEEAASEINEAFNWYEDRQKGLGDEFINSLEKYLSRITTEPLLYPKSSKEERVAVMKRFPFKIVYEVDKPAVVIYAVFHTSRNPKNYYQ